VEYINIVNLEPQTQQPSLRKQDCSSLRINRNMFINKSSGKRCINKALNFCRIHKPVKRSSNINFRYFIKLNLIK
jgi:hypothetical protein